MKRNIANALITLAWAGAGLMWAILVYERIKSEKATQQTAPTWNTTLPIDRGGNGSTFEFKPWQLLGPEDYWQPLDPKRDAARETYGLPGSRLIGACLKCHGAGRQLQHGITI